jgi:hypothetical protein
VLACLYDYYGALILPPGFPQEFLLFLGLAHDIGKLSAAFQVKCSAWLRLYGLEQIALNGQWKDGPHPHNLISQDTLERFLLKKAPEADEAIACYGLLVGAHHGRIARPFTMSRPLWRLIWTRNAGFPRRAERCLPP